MHVLTANPNERLYRTITVRGVPKSVSHAVRLLSEVSRKIYQNDLFVVVHTYQIPPELRLLSFGRFRPHVPTR